MALDIMALDIMALGIMALGIMSWHQCENLSFSLFPKFVDLLERI